MSAKTVTTKEDKRMDGNQKFWILFWVLFLGSCTIQEVAYTFSNNNTPLVNIQTGCSK